MASSATEMEGSRRIVLGVDTCGKVTVEPYYARFRRGDPIVLQAMPEVSWAIGFLNNQTPTDTLVIHGHGNRMDGEHFAMHRGHFAYSVAVQGRNELLLCGAPTIFLEVTCPEIIID